LREWLTQVCQLKQAPRRREKEHQVEQ